MATTKVAIAPMKVAQIPKSGADFQIVEREIPNSPWRNSAHSNDGADNGDSDDFVVVMVVESKNEVFSIPESLETIE